MNEKYVTPKTQDNTSVTCIDIYRQCANCHIIYCGVVAKEHIISINSLLNNTSSPLQEYKRPKSLFPELYNDNIIKNDRPDNLPSINHNWLLMIDKVAKRHD